MARIVWAFSVMALSVALGYGQNIPACEEKARATFEELLGLRGELVAVVTGIVPGSAAENLGVEIGDLVVGFNNRKLRTFVDKRDFLTEMRIAALTGQAAIDFLKFDPPSESYDPIQLIAVVSPQSEHRIIGLTLTFAYFVQEVSEGGPGELMGVKPGDFVQEVNGVGVADLRGMPDLDLMFEGPRAEGGKTVELTLGHFRPFEGKMFKNPRWKVSGDIP